MLESESDTLPLPANDNEYPPGSVAADLKESFTKSKIAQEIFDKSSEEEIDLPKHWSDEDRAAFDALDSRAKAWLLNRHRNMEGDYTRKTMALAEERKKIGRLGELTKVFQDYKDDLMLNGMDEVDATKQLVEQYRLYQSNPEYLLQSIAQKLGYDPSMLKKTQSRSAVGESYDDIKQEVVSIKQAIQQQQEHIARQALLHGSKEIAAFRAEKGSDNEARYPHFDELLPDMLALARAEISAGKKPDLKSLYDRAAWANPSTRDKLLVAQQQAAMESLKAKAKSKSAAAKKAGVSIKGAPQPGMTVAKPQRSLREELEEAFKAGFRI